MPFVYMKVWDTKQLVHGITLSCLAEKWSLNTYPFFIFWVKDCKSSDCELLRFSLIKLSFTGLFIEKLKLNMLIQSFQYSFLCWSSCVFKMIICFSLFVGLFSKGDCTFLSVAK